MFVDVYLLTQPHSPWKVFLELMKQLQLNRLEIPSGGEACKLAYVQLCTVKELNQASPSNRSHNKSSWWSERGFQVQESNERMTNLCILQEDLMWIPSILECIDHTVVQTHCSCNDIVQPPVWT